MSRPEHLQRLYDDHNNTLEMAEKIAKWSLIKDKQELNSAISEIKLFLADKLEKQFCHEEETIFITLQSQYEEFGDIASTLRREHTNIRELIKNLSPQTAQGDLFQLSSLLKEHTDIEVNHLFPMIENMFSKEQLHNVQESYSYDKNVYTHEYDLALLK